MATSAALAIDKTVTLDVNGSRQSIRLCAARTGLPPLMIVQGGPGLPLLHEAAKFQRLLNLENAFLVGYWDQRGCGIASRKDVDSVSLPQQVDDLRTVLRWLHDETQQRVLMFGISWDATIVLHAVEQESDRVTSVVGISPDLQTASSDAAAYAFLQKQDALTSVSAATELPAALAPPNSTVLRVPDAGHMVHFDQPHVVRSIVEAA